MSALSEMTRYDFVKKFCEYCEEQFKAEQLNFDITKKELSFFNVFCELTAPSQEDDFLKLFGRSVSNLGAYVSASGNDYGNLLYGAPWVSITETRLYDIVARFQGMKKGDKPYNAVNLDAIFRSCINDAVDELESVSGKQLDSIDGAASALDFISGEQLQTSLNMRLEMSKSNLENLTLLIKFAKSLMETPFFASIDGDQKFEIPHDTDFLHILINSVFSVSGDLRCMRPSQEIDPRFSDVKSFASRVDIFKDDISLDSFFAFLVANATFMFSHCELIANKLRDKYPGITPKHIFAAVANSMYPDATDALIRRLITQEDSEVVKAYALISQISEFKDKKAELEQKTGTACSDL